ncbi:PIN domain-containing protein [Thiocapsa bogorovii]|uniref:PIN domain-containing protein n=1 Tax=Thiocapsa bogorovii TaxID=521689 RepID=UPI001E4673B5|nr:PIN domain-containing protein [Thiocapsa bogorovii]UHD15480.1 PIN domain-containing protein [Thiocapsa bogorovii]
MIRLQTEAKLFVQDAIRQGVYSLAWSAILDLENIANPDMERRIAIQMWRSLASVNVDTSQRIEALAEQFAKKGIKPMDSLHVASAIEAGATWFLTTDHALLRKMRSESRLSVADPVDFIRMLQESNNEN